MARIYLIRHAQASFGTENYDRLSPRGRLQAEALGSYLADCEIQFDAVYSGELERQRTTAEIVLTFQPAGTGLRIEPRFNEIRTDEQFRRLLPAVIDSRPDVARLVESGLESSKSYQKVLEAVFRHWVSEACDERGIQSWRAYSADVRNALTELMETQGSGRTVAIFTSGGTIATAVAQILGLGGAQAYAFYEPLVNASLTRLLYSGKRVSLSCFNDYSYLELLARRSGRNLLSYR